MTKPMAPTRRKILTTAVAAVAAPMIVPSTVFGQNAPSNRIAIGAIGVGRISRVHDMKETFNYDTAQIVAVCDLDSKRVTAGQQFVDAAYARKYGRAFAGTRGFGDHRELLARKDIDAVIISTPDHQHALLATHAVQAGKDVYMQKPASLTIADGRKLANTVQASDRILQVGSQQRSDNPWPQFRRACELVRNGRIGALRHVEVGLPGDPAGPEAAAMPVPTNLNYDAWLGPTPEVYYTEIRVHPQDGSFSRPGWLRCEQFGAGMITGWGAHHIDTAHWGMDMEHSGPVEVWGDAEFPKSGLWNVHGKFLTHAVYANGVTMDISGDFPNGIKFVGTQGWIFVSRDAAVTASDPSWGIATPGPLVASDPRILDSVIGSNEIHLYKSSEQHGNWLESIRSRKPPSAPIEIGHRACSTCLIHQVAMHLKRKVYWDPVAERFKNDDEANSWLSRAHREPYAL